VLLDRFAHTKILFDLSTHKQLPVKKNSHYRTVFVFRDKHASAPELRQYKTLSQTKVFFRR